MNNIIHVLMFFVQANNSALPLLCISPAPGSEYFVWLRNKIRTEMGVSCFRLEVAEMSMRIKAVVDKFVQEMKEALDERCFSWFWI